VSTRFEINRQNFKGDGAGGRATGTYAPYTRQIVSFVEFILSHKNRVEEALIDQFFNSSKKRLARALLVLGGYGKAQHQPDDELPAVSQKTWSEIIGTMRSRVNFFMNKFRKLGFVEYQNRKIKIN
jgi:CRP-like cAMP-binding protein